MHAILRQLAVVALTGTFALTGSAAARAETLLKSICRVKGQEENTLQGFGIVVGLKGTGDGAGFAPTVRSLRRVMDQMNLHSGDDAELKDAKNVALVTVTATVPAAGARQGDKIDCTISAVAAKSLEGGRLFLTPLVGPDPSNPQVFAFAEGPISLDDPAVPTTGRIHAGCRLEEDFFNPFTKNGILTLVLDPDHADFATAQEVAEQVNTHLSFQSSGVVLARALNQANVEVTVPAQYREDPVLFVSQVLDLPILDLEPPARVVINERAGSIVISGDVEVGPAVVSHKNVVIETGGDVPADRFVAVDSDEASRPTLKGLVEALNGVHVPTADIIDIIKGLKRNGHLHGQLIIE